MDEKVLVTDHSVIRRWVETRQGIPATVKVKNGLMGVEILKIDFLDSPDKALERVSWGTWFALFEQNQLAFLCDMHLIGNLEHREFSLVVRDYSGNGESEPGTLNERD